MSWFVFLIFLNIEGDPIRTDKLAQPFSFEEDCRVFGELKAGQVSGPRDVAVPVCLKLRK